MRDSPLCFSVHLYKRCAEIVSSEPTTQLKVRIRDVAAWRLLSESGTSLHKYRSLLTDSWLLSDHDEISQLIKSGQHALASTNKTFDDGDKTSRRRRRYRKWSHHTEHLVQRVVDAVLEDEE